MGARHLGQHGPEGPLRGEIVAHMPVCVQRQKLQLQHSKGCRPPCRTAEVVFHGPDCLVDHTVIDVPVVQVVQVSRCRRGGDSRDLTVAAVEKSPFPRGPGQGR